MVPDQSDDVEGSRYRTLQLCAIVPAMMLPFLASLFYFVIFSGTLVAQVFYAGIKLFTVLWPIVVYRTFLRRDRRRARSGNISHRESFWIGLFVGLFIVIGMLVVMDTGIGIAVRRSSDAIREKISEIGIRDYYWTFGIFLAVFHSMIEEFYWRWFVYGELSSFCRPSTAHLLTGVSFASHHVVIVSQFFPLPVAMLFGAAVCAGGILWSILYERQGTLAGAWLSHMIVDLGILAIGYDLIVPHTTL